VLWDLVTRGTKQKEGENKITDAWHLKGGSFEVDPTDVVAPAVHRNHGEFDGICKHPFFEP